MSECLRYTEQCFSITCAGSLGWKYIAHISEAKRLGQMLPEIKYTLCHLIWQLSFPRCGIEVITRAAGSTWLCIGVCRWCRCVYKSGYLCWSSALKRDKPVNSWATTLFVSLGKDKQDGLYEPHHCTTLALCVVNCEDITKSLYSQLPNPCQYRQKLQCPEEPKQAKYIQRKCANAK